MVQIEIKSLVGRPTYFSEKATERINLRFSVNEKEKLERASDDLNMPRAMVLRYLINSLDIIKEHGIIAPPPPRI